MRCKSYPHIHALGSFWVLGGKGKLNILWLLVSKAHEL